MLSNRQYRSNRGTIQQKYTARFVVSSPLLARTLVEVFRISYNTGGMDTYSLPENANTLTSSDETPPRAFQTVDKDMCSCCQLTSGPNVMVQISTGSCLMISNVMLAETSGNYTNTLHNMFRVGAVNPVSLNVNHTISLQVLREWTNVIRHCLLLITFFYRLC